MTDETVLTIPGHRVEVHLGALVPNEVRELLKPLLVDVVPLAPSWLHDLRVFWVPEPEDEGSAATITAHVEYRFAQLGIRPLFLSATEVERRDNLLHEMLHLTLASSDELLQEVLAVLRQKNQALYATLEKRREALLEGAIVDLTRTFAFLQPMAGLSRE